MQCFVPSRNPKTRQRTKAICCSFVRRIASAWQGGCSVHPLPFPLMILYRFFPCFARGCCTTPSIKWILHLIDKNTFSSRTYGAPGRKRCKESIFALAGQALLRKNAPRTAHVAAADYSWRDCGPSKPPRVFRLPSNLCRLIRQVW